MPVTKSELMAVIAKSNGRIHESFEHEHEGIFDVTAMRAWAVKQQLQPLRVAISDVLEMIQKTRICDMDRVRELPEASWRRDPAMVVVYKDGTHLMIDGTHRVLRRHMEGETLFLTYLVPQEFIIRPVKGEWVRGEEMGIKWGADVSTLK